MIRRVAFASLAGGNGCSTVASRIATTLASRRAGGVLLVLAAGEDRRAEQLAAEGGRHHSARGIETIALPDPVWPGGIDNWRTPVSYTHLDVYKRQFVDHATGNYTDPNSGITIDPETLQVVDPATDESER